MIKKIIILIIFSVVLNLLSGCNEPNDISKNDAQLIEDETADSIQKQSEDKPNTEVTNNLPTHKELSNEELSNAEEVIREYYQDTIFELESIKLDLSISFYEQYYSEYYDKDLITFLVSIKNSENPPREIALYRQSSDSNWEIISEGY